MKILGKQMKLKGAAADSLLLTFVKIITAMLGLLTTKLLAVHFSLQEYGTYSQAMLIASTATSLSILGLSDATNYYYNANDDELKKQKAISTIFGIQYILGVICALLITAGYIPLIRYFDNESLKNVIFFAAWMPVFNNLIPMLQVLFVSIGKAKAIAIRNLVISTARLLFVIIASYIIKSINIIFVLILFMDVAQVVYFMGTFNREKFSIKLSHFSRDLVPGILRFSLPLAVFVLTNALSRDIDKYVISYFTDTETLAIYTNAAKVLPFDIVTGSFLTVMIPILTRQIRSSRFNEAGITFKSYLRVGYLATWILAGGAVVVAKELILFLYAPKYLPGLSVFIVYLFVDMIKFANTSIVLSACGKTKILMKCSIITLITNTILNIFTIKMFGIIGPAISTFIVTLGLTFSLIYIGATEIQQHFLKLFDWKEVFILIIELLCVGTAVYFVKELLYKYTRSTTVILIVSYVLFEGTLLLLNRKKIISSLKEINKLK